MRLQTFALLEEWVAPAKEKSRDEALTELALRYFNSRAPVTIQDFIWWSGLSASEARAGFEAVKSNFVQEVFDGKIYWMPSNGVVPKERLNAFALPGFDEYLLGYKDRSAVLDSAHAEQVCPGGNGVFFSTIVIDGQVAGTWKRAIKKSRIEVVAAPFGVLSKADKNRFVEAVNRYGEFLGMPVTVL